MRSPMTSPCEHSTIGVVRLLDQRERAGPLRPFGQALVELDLESELLREWRDSLDTARVRTGEHAGGVGVQQQVHERACLRDPVATERPQTVVALEAPPAARLRVTHHENIHPGRRLDAERGHQLTIVVIGQTAYGVLHGEPGNFVDLVVRDELAPASRPVASASTARPSAGPCDPGSGPPATGPRARPGCRSPRAPRARRSPRPTRRARTCLSAGSSRRSAVGAPAGPRAGRRERGATALRPRRVPRRRSRRFLGRSVHTVLAATRRRARRPATRRGSCARRAAACRRACRRRRPRRTVSAFCATPRSQVVATTAS